jgi:hypothetical protein
MFEMRETKGNDGHRNPSVIIYVLGIIAIVTGIVVTFVGVYVSGFFIQAILHNSYLDLAWNGLAQAIGLTLLGIVLVVLPFWYSSRRNN